ncbi:aspartate-semialdehyde dehydrogenase [Anaerorhabdus furcosa]|uniref:Aspartate-semialdehyde dehydrogenase n=1 Tax=Anaerorhabdus furcosa TaxID=118967 RepID=A0A1T4LAT0_9FIRM|nr:aspartate-semialdehyde dehydrogenase [Anaerorhabdus furcosa]SJZ51750.1 aspartate-semialdehyde dehydrogenase [Anaerorhabdus furcosa]
MKIGILGCTGAVGQQMMRVLEERKLDIEELRLFASERSVGKTFEFNGKIIEVENMTNKNFDGLDYVLGALEADLSKEIAQVVVDAGAVYIDNSSAFRMNENVPLVVPEVNPEDCFKHSGIIANPNCSTIISMVAMNGINKCSKIEKIIASTYQAVSGAGVKGMQELNAQIRALAQGQVVLPEVFTKQIAYNCIPQIGSYDKNGYTSEEMKMQNEGRKILHNDKLLVNCTCVRVPVIRSHSISITCITEEKVELEQIKKSLQETKGIVLENEPTPLEVSNQDLVYVGRLRNDLVFENGISLWCVGDQIRKGAATNAIQIIEVLESGIQTD